MNEQRWSLYAFGLVLIILAGVDIWSVWTKANEVRWQPLPYTPFVDIDISASAGNTEFHVIHCGGDFIDKAFGGPTEFGNLEVRVNGSTSGYTAFRLNGVTPVSGMGFRAGDMLTLTRSSPLRSGDIITVVYAPTSEVLHRATVF